MGNCGVGITPTYKLHVANAAGSAATRNYKYVIGTATSTALVYTASTSFATICAKFGSSIWSEGLTIASSDIRIKKDIESFDNIDSLNKLLLLNQGKYKCIDETMNKEKYKTYGFVAQELKNVIPEMVQVETNFIPNIQKQVQYDKENKIINITFEYDIVVGKKLKIYREGCADELTAIIAERVDDYSFKVDKDIESENVIIYGEEVEDFLTITKESLIPVVVSGVQKLHRKIVRVEDSIKTLVFTQQTEIDELKEKLNIIMNHLNL